MEFHRQVTAVADALRHEGRRSAGILPAVPRASRPRCGGRDARRDGGATKLIPVSPFRSKLFHALAHAEHMLGQLQAAAFFEDGNQLVEFRPGVRARDHDADGMKQLFSLRPGFGFHFIHDLFETFRRELGGYGRFVFQNLDREAVQDSFGMRPGQHLGIVGRGQGSLRSVIEDQ